MFTCSFSTYREGRACVTMTTHHPLNQHYTNHVQLVHEGGVSDDGVHGDHKLHVLCDLHGRPRSAGVGLHSEPVQAERGEVKLLGRLTCTGEGRGGKGREGQGRGGEGRGGKGGGRGGEGREGGDRGGEGRGGEGRGEGGEGRGGEEGKGGGRGGEGREGRDRGGEGRGGEGRERGGEGRGGEGREGRGEERGGDRRGDNTTVPFASEQDNHSWSVVTADTSGG